MARVAPTELGTSDARKRLPKLVHKAASRSKGATSVSANAVLIRARGKKGAAALVPEVDLEAAKERERRLKERIEKLEDELEDIGIALFLQERLASSNGRRLSADEFLAGIDFEGHIERGQMLAYTQAALRLKQRLAEEGRKSRSSRRLGTDRGAFEVPEDFDAPLPNEILDAFEGADTS